METDWYWPELPFTSKASNRMTECNDKIYKKQKKKPQVITVGYKIMGKVCCFQIMRGHDKLIQNTVM